MPGTIQDYLNAIENAKYGEQVRSAIHDSIEMCYSDVSTGTTQIDAAITAAGTATNSANTAASNAQSASNEWYDSLTNTGLKKTVEAAIDSINNPNTGAYVKAISVVNEWTALKPQITQAKTDANTAKDSANSAASSATTAANEWNNTYKDQVTGAISSATTAASTAGTKAGEAQTAATAANNAASAATGVVNEWNNTYKGQITTAAASANTAANVISNLTVHSQDVGPNTEASAVYRDLDGHKDLLLNLRQGQPGEPFRILGSYDSLATLRSAVSNPSVGDMYNIGTSPSFNIYRYTGLENTGSDEDWENNGSIGEASVANLSNSEIDSIWRGTQPSTANNKYANQSGLYYLAYTKIKSALNNKVDKENKAGTSTPKVLSDNNFSDAYVNTITDHGTRVSALESGKVDKVTGQGLSDLNFTQSYATAIGDNASSISTLSTIVGNIQTTVSANQPTTFTVTLSVGSWSNNQQTVTNSGFKSSGKAYIVEPDYDSRNAYISANVVAKNVETNNQMIFTCDSVPSGNLTVQILCIGVS